MQRIAAFGAAKRKCAGTRSQRSWRSIARKFCASAQRRHIVSTVLTAGQNNIRAARRRLRRRSIPVRRIYIPHIHAKTEKTANGFLCFCTAYAFILYTPHCRTAGGIRLTDPAGMLLRLRSLLRRMSDAASAYSGPALSGRCTARLPQSVVHSYRMPRTEASPTWRTVFCSRSESRRQLRFRR